MWVGAADAASKKGEGQRAHAGFVMGKDDVINRIHNKIGMKSIHMSDMSERDRAHAIQNLDLNSNELYCRCFYLDRQRNEEELLNHGGLKARTPKISIHRNFDKYWLRSFRGSLDVFLAQYKIEISDVVMQTDFDMSHAVRTWGMQNACPGKAHDLMDIVAWCNVKGIKIQGCKVMDVRDEIRKGMHHDLLK